VELAWWRSVVYFASSNYCVPIGKVVSCYLQRVPRLVSRIELRVYYMRVCKCHRHEIVKMGGKASEACLVAHEAMDEYKKNPPEI
jgi:hypothetical protein